MDPASVSRLGFWSPPPICEALAIALEKDNAMINRTIDDLDVCLFIELLFY
jgi:hypothetical protein